MNSKQIRAVVLGSKGAGKSSLMAQICNSYINENLEYERKITDAKLDTELLVQFSDRMEDIQSAKTCFLIIDLTSKESLELVKNTLYPKVSTEMSRDGFIYLIGNKNDLEDKREVSSEEFIQFASEKCLMYAETCCLSGKKKGIDVVQRMFKNRLINILKSSKKIESQRKLEEVPYKDLSKSDVKDNEEVKNESVPPELPPRDNNEFDSEGLLEFPLQTTKQPNESNILFNSNEIPQELIVEQETKDENQFLLQELNGKIQEHSEPTFGQQSSITSYQTNQVNDITLNPQAPIVNTSLESITPANIGVPSTTPQFQITEEGLIIESLNSCQPYKSPFKERYSDLPLVRKKVEVRGEIKEEEFLEQLDEDVKKSAETLKLLNERYNQRTSPNFKKCRDLSKENMPRKPLPNEIPVFESSLIQNDVNIKSILKDKPTNYPSPKPIKAFKDNKSFVQALRVSGKENMDSLLTIEVMLKPGMSISLNVRKNDDSVYLAEKCLSIGRIQPNKGLINSLAKVIEQSISAEIHKLLENIKKEKARILQEKTMQEKKSMSKPLSVERHKVEDKKIIGRLLVLIKNNKTSEIVIREGDAPEVLAKNFTSKHSLSGNTYHTILEALQKLISTHKSTAKKEQVEERLIKEIHASPILPSARRRQSNCESTPRSSSRETKSLQKLLFKVNFTLVDGRKASISVKEKDNLYILARNFAVIHKLTEETTERVWELLQESYKKHLQKIEAEINRAHKRQSLSTN